MTTSTNDPAEHVTLDELTEADVAYLEARSDAELDGLLGLLQSTVDDFWCSILTLFLFVRNRLWATLNVWSGTNVAGFFDLDVSGGTQTFNASPTDPTQAPFFIDVALDNNVTSLTVTGGQKGQSHRFRFKSSGSFTVVFAGVGGTAPTINDSATNDGYTMVDIEHVGTDGWRFV